MAAFLSMLATDRNIVHVLLLALLLLLLPWLHSHKNSMHNGL